jgi:hypothetical protein
MQQRRNTPTAEETGFMNALNPNFSNSNIATLGGMEPQLNEQRFM